MSHSLLRLALVLVAGLLSACSSFDAHWKEAAQGKNGATRWDGSWTSGAKTYANGAHHHGRLRCVLEPVLVAKAAQSHHGPLAKETSGPLRAYFHANWVIFSGNYDMILQPVPGKPQQYRGTHDLPAIFGGRYQYAAAITADHFSATYTCSIDRGAFDLHRLPFNKK